jgi:hypothetical protein
MELTARRSARMLLAAWNSADLKLIQNAIEEAHQTETGRLRSADAERIEMLQEVARVIRQWMAGHKSSSDLRASLDLLRHLAGVNDLNVPVVSETHAYGPQ